MTSDIEGASILIILIRDWDVVNSVFRFISTLLLIIGLDFARGVQFLPLMRPTVLLKCFVKKCAYQWKKWVIHTARYMEYFTKSVFTSKKGKLHYSKFLHFFLKHSNIHLGKKIIFGPN